MTDMTPNIPEVVEEVRARFEAYEAALETKDVAVLDATFWESPHTIRYALHENGYGFDEIHAHRVARPPGPGIKEARRRLEILTLGRDYAVVNLEFKVRGRDPIGRQRPDLGALPRPRLEGRGRARLHVSETAFLVGRGRNGGSGFPSPRLRGEVR